MALFQKTHTWRVIGNFEVGGGGSQRPNLFRGGSKAALVFQTGGAKVKKKSSVGEVRITHCTGKVSHRVSYGFVSLFK